MVQPGPAPIPTKLKQLRGNPGKRALNKNEVQPDATPPECPTWLDETAKTHWAGLAPKLIELGLLTSIDGDAFAAYCQAYAEFKEATETLREEGRVCTSVNGSVTSHPAVKQQRSAWTAMKNYSVLFGLDPSSRSRLSIGGKPEEEDPFEGFLKNRA